MINTGQTFWEKQIQKIRQALSCTPSGINLLRSDMAESHELGQTGEERAASYLEQNGYRILRRNWKAGKHEIDIIAETDDYIVFVEVKTRSENYLVNPSEAVSPEKQRSIIFAADNFIRRNNIDKEGRFDIIIIIKKCNSFEIDHTKDAFYATLR